MSIDTAHLAFDTTDKTVAAPMEHAFAASRAVRVARELVPYCEVIGDRHALLVTGSIRRGKALCKDIDMAVLPKPMMWPQMRARILKHCKLDTDGNERFSAFFADGIKLDLWIARPEERDLLQNRTPTNFGMLCLVSTGSMEHNIVLANRARDNGLHFHPTLGIQRDGRVIACETEEQVFAALRMPFVEPSRRNA